MKIDPLNPAAQIFPGLIHLWDGQIDLDLQSFQKTYLTFPEEVFIRMIYIMILIVNQRYDEAWPILGQLAKDIPGYPLVVLWLKFKSTIEGEKSEVLQLKSGALKIWAWRDFSVSYFVSECFSLIDMKSDALDWLNHSIDLGMINYPYLNEHDPFLQNLRGEPRFQKLMERVKYEWEHFEVWGIIFRLTFIIIPAI